MEETIVILAAGIGSRYGGLKQIDSLGNNGESIIDFSIYDAIKAGFKKLVLIIQPQHEELFEKNLVAKIRPFIKVEYAYQSFDYYLDNYQISAERTKPFGTVHALLCAKEKVGNNPFIVINADDYYGYQAYKYMFDFIQTKLKDKYYGMVGYTLDKTLSAYGSVTRGICQVENGLLKAIREENSITLCEDKVYFDGVETSPKQACSMNFWAFSASIFELLQPLWTKFLDENLASNPLKCEYVIPNAIQKLVQEHLVDVEVILNDDRWIGVTYQEDKPEVKRQLALYKEKGLYPFDLWLK